jgi:hypothetical protein
MTYVTAYSVVDCPDHPSSALVLASGTFCFHCGRSVCTPDGVILTEPFTLNAPEALKAEARAAWNDSQVIRDFAGSMQRERGAVPLRVAS